MRRVFFNRGQIFPPIRGTSHLSSDCTRVRFPVQGHGVTDSVSVVVVSQNKRAADSENC